MTKPSNPPAFPSNISNNFDNLAAGLHSGMTLRDYYAIRFAVAYRQQDMHESSDKISEWSYQDADAMLSERESL